MTSRWCQNITSAPIPQRPSALPVNFAIYIPDVYLQVLDAELMAVHVDGRQEDGLHLVVAQFVRRQVRRDQHLKIQSQELVSSFVEQTKAAFHQRVCVCLGVPGGHAGPLWRWWSC